MREIKITTSVTEYLNDELSNDIQKLVELAKEQTQKSYAPYSEFRVGAAVLLENGEVILGNNQENAAYPSGLCAERTAIFYANSQYPNVPVEKIAVAAFTNNEFTPQPITPCGGCLQVLTETETRFKKPITVILYGKKKTYVLKNVKSLMPLSFEKDSLLNN